MDSPLTMIQTPTGMRRGFLANATSFYVESADPWSMDGAKTNVMSGSRNAHCGRWLHTAHIQGTNTLGFVHREDNSNCSNWPDARKAMECAVSLDYGSSWFSFGRILTDSNPAVSGFMSCIGDCTVVDGGDAKYYANCMRFRPNEGRTIVARALISNPTSDKVTFKTLPEPLMLIDDGANEDANAAPPRNTDWVSYPTMMNYTNNKNRIGNQFLMSHAYIPPGKGYDRRYLVFRDVSITMNASPVTPQVGLALSRWTRCAKGLLVHNCTCHRCFVECSHASL